MQPCPGAPGFTPLNSTTVHAGNFGVGGGVGIGLGIGVGMGMGLGVGDGVGLAEGCGVGATVGTGEGLAVGATVGAGVGKKYGQPDSSRPSAVMFVYCPCGHLEHFVLPGVEVRYSCEGSTPGGLHAEHSSCAA